MSGRAQLIPLKGGIREGRGSVEKKREAECKRSERKNRKISEDKKKERQAEWLKEWLESEKKKNDEKIVSVEIEAEVGSSSRGKKSTEMIAAIFGETERVRKEREERENKNESGKQKVSELRKDYEEK